MKWHAAVLRLLLCMVGSSCGLTRLAWVARWPVKGSLTYLGALARLVTRGQVRQQAVLLALTSCLLLWRPASLACLLPHPHLHIV